MNELAKCPVCGQRLTGDIDGVVLCWNGCSFRCGGYALPRIAAAMELARAEVNTVKLWESGKCPDEESADHAKAVLHAAQHKVHKVFGGE